MGIKLKAFGLGLLAVMAMAAFGIVNAAADNTTGGHFTSTVKKTVLTGTENGVAPHTTELKVAGFEKGIVCNHALYESTFEGETVESITVTPTYKECRTTGGTAGETTVDVNNCGYTFTIGKKAVGHNTVKIVCKGATKYIAVTHAGCEIRVPEQLMTGIAYNTILENEKHSITLEATITNAVTTHFEAGFCVLLGTKKLSSFTGSVTVTGWEDLGNDETHPYGKEGNQVSITATGTEG